MTKETDNILEKLKEGYLAIMDKGKVKYIRPSYGTVSVKYRDNQPVLVSIEHTEQIKTV